MTESLDARAAAVGDDEIRGMVAELRPDWTVESIERSPLGTDLVAIIEVGAAATPDRAVLKATTAAFVPDPIARAEPRLLDLVDRETDIPVPSPFAYCDDHPDFPTPFYLLEYVDGENYEDGYEDLAVDVRERIIRAAGRNLARLHELGPLPAYGRIGVQDGALTVLDTENHPRYDDFHAMCLADLEETLDSLTEGGFFPDLAEQPDRFANIVPPVREYVREAFPALPDPEPPTYCHWDYRYGNLLVDPETGETRAVLDWANLTATDPANNLAKVELHLLAPETDGEPLTDRFRHTFREAYADERADWSFSAPVCERMRVYKLKGRLEAMACLPLWYQDASPVERDQRADEHRAFVAQYL